MPLIARLAMVFASGAIAGSFLAGFPLLPYAALLCIAVACAATKNPEVRALATIASFGLMLGAFNTKRERMVCVHLADGAQLAVTGIIETRPNENRRTASARADGFGACRSIRVRLPDDEQTWLVGDAVEARGTWMLQRISVDHGSPSDGMLVANTARHAMNVRGPALLRARGRAQERIRVLFPTAYPIAEALLVAQMEDLPPRVREDFAASGLTHVLAISGSHVAIVAGVFLLGASLLRLPAQSAALASFIGAFAYVMFLGAPFAAVRSLIQMALVLLSRRLQRPAHPVGMLATAALIITMIDPAAPLDAGFQLSFAGILGIILWRRRLIDAQPAAIPTQVRDAIATTLSATLMTTPIAAFHFGIVSVVSIVANLLAGPVVALSVPVTAAALAISYVSMPVAHFIAGGAELVLIWLYHIAQTSAAAPFGHFYVSAFDVVIWTTAVLAGMHVLRGSYRDSKVARAALCALVVALLLTASPLLTRLQPAGLQIHLLDVGQGDAIAIRSPRGRWLLVDAGPLSDKFDAGKSRVVPFLLHHHASRIEALIISHPHLDHFGGVMSTAERVHVETILDPGMPVSNPRFDQLLAFAQQRSIPWFAARNGSALEFDGVHLDFISPAGISLDPAADANDYSAAFRLRYRGFTALFTGDLGKDIEEDLMQRAGGLLDVDLLKVGHHGSGGSSGESFLERTTPQVALISAGRRNRYHHPHRQALERLRASGARIFRTDEDGTVSIFIGADGRMSVRTAQ